MDNSTIFLIANACIYAVILYYNIRGLRRYSGSSLIISFLFFSAVCSVLFYVHPYTEQTIYYREISWVALAYFCVLTMAMMYSVRYFDTNCQDIIELTSEAPIRLYMRIFLPVQLFLIVGYLPAFFEMSNSDMAVMRDRIGEGDVNPNQFVLKIFSQLMWRYENLKLLSTIIAIYAYFFIHNNRNLVVAFTIVSLLFPIYTSFLFLMRSQMFLQVVFIGFFLILFRKRLTYKQKKNLLWIGGYIATLVFFVLIAISQGRFGDLASWMYYKYSGETFVNFAGQLWTDLKGSTGGYAYFRWLIDGTDWVGLFDKWEFIEQTTGIDAHIFYGAIGQIAMEFGIVASAVIHLIIAFIFYRLIHTKNYLSLPNMILIGLLVYYILYGFYIFPFQGTAILQVFYILIAYFVFKRFSTKVKIRL